MTPFKFFQREIKGTLDLYEGETYATASLHDQTPEGVMGRRRLYHTDLPEYHRQMYQRLREDEIMTQQQYNLNRDMMAEQERVRRRLIETDNQIRLFQATTVTTVNPKWWMKVKMFYQKFKYNSVIETNSEALGIFIITTSITIGVGLIISKILNVW
jgi:hypothetical protein